MILGALYLLFANAAVLLAAHSLVCHLRSGRPWADLLLFLLLRLLLVSVTVLVAGLLRVLVPFALGAAGLAVLALLLARGEHRRLACVPWPNLAPAWAALGALLAVRLLFQVWFFAPYLEDALGYHLPKIAEWVRAGGFTGELGVDVRSTFPAGFELVETWWVVFLHHDALVEMGGVEFFLVGVAAVGAIAEGLGWGMRTAGIASLLFALNPAFHFQATSAANDGAVTALFLAAGAFIVAGSPPLLVLLPVALGVGVKPTLLYALPGLVLLGALLPRGQTPEPRPPRTLFLVAGTAILVGSFWYLRNWALYGNPIHPMGFGGMRSAASGATLQRLGPSLRTLGENLSCFVDLRIYDDQRAPDAFCTTTFGWGPAGFAVGSLALVPLLRTDVLLRRLALGFTAAAVSIFSLVELDPWYTRFIVFVAALPALGLARLWDRHRIVRILGMLALAIQLAETAVPGNLPAGALPALVHQGWRERSAVPPPPEAPDARIAYACDQFGLAYPLYLPDYSRGLVYLRDETVDQLLAHVDREGVTRIYVTGTLPQRGAIIEEAVRRGRLRLIGHGPWRIFAVIPGG